MARRALLAAGAAALVGGAAAATVASRRPGPSAAALKMLFERGGAARHAALEEGRPTDVVTRTFAYRDDLLLDVHAPAERTDPLPVVVWVHGGGHLSGSRTDDAGWFARLAAEGAVVVSVDYRLAPGTPYPGALLDVCDALAVVVDRAAELGGDATRVVLGGDSAGAQMCAQLATAATSSAYAERSGLRVPLAPGSLRGVVLACGYYDLDAFRAASRSQSLPVRWLATTVLWSVTGSRDPAAELVEVMSAGRHVTADFPPTVVLGGDGDPLTCTQSQPLADHLRRLGVDVTALFPVPAAGPALPHEYQFDLGLPEARDAFTTIAAFTHRVTA